MKSFFRMAVGALVLGGGLFLMASPAQAAPASGLGSGNSVSVPISVAANFCGNGIGLLGSGVGISKECEAEIVNKSEQKHFFKGHGLGR